ncbi:MAG: hypothetical protein H0T58_00275 [Gemmatimonadales bacterium]|nr:hypothetical protein [Gemmatimonadales bacterium]
MLAPDAELGALPYKFLFGVTGRVMVDPDIQHVHASLILTVVSANVCERTLSLYHDGYAVQL